MKIPRDQARCVKEIIDQLRLRASVSVDGIERAPLFFFGQLPGIEYLPPAKDRIERGTQFVRYGRKELVFQTTRSFRMLAKCFFPQQQTLAFRLNTLSLDKLADLAPDRVQHVDQARVVEHGCTREEFDNPEKLVSDLYRKSGRMNQSGRPGIFRTRELLPLIRFSKRDRCVRLPDVSGKSETARKILGEACLAKSIHCLR